MTCLQLQHRLDTFYIPIHGKRQLDTQPNEVTTLHGTWLWTTEHGRSLNQDHEPTPGISPGSSPGRKFESLCPSISWTAKMHISKIISVEGIGCRKDLGLSCDLVRLRSRFIIIIIACIFNSEVTHNYSCSKYLEISHDGIGDNPFRTQPSGICFLKSFFWGLQQLHQTSGRDPLHLYFWAPRSSFGGSFEALRELPIFNTNWM